MVKLPENAHLLKFTQARMPFGKYKGSLLIDLPEPYVVRFRQKGLPKGTFGEMLGLLYEIKVNGLVYLFDPIRKKGAAGHEQVDDFKRDQSMLKLSSAMVVIMTILPYAVFAQADADLDSYTNRDLRRKYVTYTIFRNGGITVIGLAAASLVSGILLVSNTEPFPEGGTKGTTYPEEEANRRITGLDLLSISIPIAVAGSVFTVIGSKKHREYRERMQLQGMRVLISGGRASIGFNISF